LPAAHETVPAPSISPNRMILPAYSSLRRSNFGTGAGPALRCRRKSDPGAVILAISLFVGRAGATIPRRRLDRSLFWLEADSSPPSRSLHRDLAIRCWQFRRRTSRTAFKSAGNLSAAGRRAFVTAALGEPSLPATLRPHARQQIPAMRDYPPSAARSSATPRTQSLIPKISWIRHVVSLSVTSG